MYNTTSENNKDNRYILIKRSHTNFETVIVSLGMDKSQKSKDRSMIKERGNKKDLSFLYN